MITENSNLVENWIWKPLDKNRVCASYQAKRGNYNRKSFILPNTYRVDERFMEAISLYLGDGDFNRKEKRHLTFCSKDKELATFFLNFLRDYFFMQNSDITILIQYKKRNKYLRQEWSKVLRVKKDKIITRFSDRHRNEVCHIQVNGVVFRKIFEKIIHNVLSTAFLQKPDLRRAFLRGLFAAEGNIGIDYLEKKHYISQITYNLSLFEESLKDFICRGLELEHVHYKIFRDEKDHSLEINIQRWDNYLKLWSISVFDLCQRKKDKFIAIAKKLDIYVQFNDTFRREFFKRLPLLQKQIANVIDSWQANVSRTITGEHLLRIEQLLKLLNYTNITKEEVKPNINAFRVGTLTLIQPSLEVFEFLEEFKLF